jgi:hypothetical protein
MTRNSAARARQFEENEMVHSNVTRSRGLWWLATASAALGLIIHQPRPALAQIATPAPAQGALDCLPLGQPLPKIPEIVAQKTSDVAGAGRVLRGTVLLANEKQRIAYRSRRASATRRASQGCTSFVRSRPSAYSAD